MGRYEDSTFEICSDWKLWPAFYYLKSKNKILTSVRDLNLSKTLKFSHTMKFSKTSLATIRK